MINWNRWGFPCFLAIVLGAFLSAGYMQTHAPAAFPTLGSSAQPTRVELPIVMYHHILKEESRLNKYTISPGEFRQDMQYLKDEGYTPVVVADLIAFTQGEPLPERPVMITFDDGYESFHEYAAPILQEFGFRAVFSVVGRYVDQYSETDDHHIRYSHATWDQLLEMQQSGVAEIQNHSYDLHSTDRGRKGSQRRSGESAEAYAAFLQEDLQRLQQACQEHLGYAPTAFTYPFGLISPEALPVIRKMGFLAAFTCTEKINFLSGDPQELYTLHRFNRPHGQSFQQILEKARREKKN